MINEILAPLGLGAIIIAAVSWLARSIVLSIISKDLESYKAKLIMENEKSIELLKFDLRNKALEYEIKFGKLHDKRAEVIAEIYSKLAEAIYTTTSFVSPTEFEGEPSKQEKAKAASKAIWELWRYFQKNKIYISEPISLQVDNLIEKIRKPALEFAFFVNPEIEKSDYGQKNKLEAWIKAWDAMTKTDIPAARK
ncbi:MAG: hypothetical protein GX409_04265 [candidate division Zixibacteria bacterium]|nr:hypothetical protein [candidate division Zixibacteria bacterium]